MILISLSLSSPVMYANQFQFVEKRRKGPSFSLEIYDIIQCPELTILE
jgi:hypothetical protein